MTSYREIISTNGDKGLTAYISKSKDEGLKHFAKRLQAFKDTEGLMRSVAISKDDFVIEEEE